MVDFILVIDFIRMFFQLLRKGLVVEILVLLAFSDITYMSWWCKKNQKDLVKLNEKLNEI